MAGTKISTGSPNYGVVVRKIEDMLRSGKYEEAIDIVLNGGSRPELIDLLVESAKTQTTALVKGSGSIKKNAREALSMLFVICNRFPQVSSELMDHFTDEVVGTA